MSALTLVVPVRSFSAGKSRLADRLEPDQRRRIARSLAEVVVDDKHELPTYVVCDDDSIVAWATSRNAAPVRVDAVGLNESLTAARATILAESNTAWYAIVHADLPLANDLGVRLSELVTAAPTNAAVLVTDRAGDGTNVLILTRPIFERWTFEYGPRSCAAHRGQSRRLGIESIIVEGHDLSVDLDTADDLDDPRVDSFVRSVLADGVVR